MTISLDPITQTASTPLDGPALDQVLAAIADRAAEHDRLGDFPHEAFPALHEVGALNLTLPSALGGGGAGITAGARLVERLGRADPSVALVVSMHVRVHAELAQRPETWPTGALAAVQKSSIDGVALINNLNVEPELGTPARGGLPASIARRQSDGAWKISGRKIYSTGAPALRWGLVSARTDEDEPRFGLFLVDFQGPGVEIDETWDHLGLRASGSHDAVFTDVLVPEDHVIEIKAPGTGRAADPLSWGWGALTIAALYTGVASAARDWLVGYLNERVPTNLGKPLASLPRFQQSVGEIEALLFTNRRLIDGVAQDLDAGGAPTEASLVKHLATENAIRAVDIALTLTANPGLKRSNPLERHHRDVLCGRIHTPQADVVLTAAGRTALERPR